MVVTGLDAGEKGPTEKAAKNGRNSGVTEWSVSQKRQGGMK